MITKYIIYLALCFQGSSAVTRFMPTSMVVRVAAMAARDEGYNPDVEGTYLDRKNGEEPIDGYASIGLFKNGHLIRFYSIRIATGDVVDPMTCKIYRFPDLIEFKKTIMKNLKTLEVSPDVIGTEIGCDNMKIVPSNAPANNSK